MTILVTGGAGFIGSNFIKHMLSVHDYPIVNLDLLTYAGNLDNLESVSTDSRYHFVKGDIQDTVLVNDIFQRYDIRVVVNFAAESHVDRSILNPGLFMETNVAGTQVLLEAARKYWHETLSSEGRMENKDNVKFIQISTDEVYGTLGKYGHFTEETPLAPNSPYSASKAAGDLLVRAYFKTYGLPMIITRCSNNYGPYQNPEKLIPLMINRAVKGERLPVYGDGKQVRDWLHVADHCIAIDRVLHTGRVGEVYNIGGNNEKENIEIVNYLLNHLGQSDELVDYVQDRLGHDRRYAIDNSKITAELDWNPSYTIEEGLDMTIDWYVTHKEWIASISRRMKLTQSPTRDLYSTLN